MSDDPFQPESNGRTPEGRFDRGNQFARGKGNPSLRRMHELRAAMQAALTPEILGGIASKMAALALDGDVQAAKLVLDHALGRPPQAISLTDGDGEPLSFAAIEGAVLAALEGLGADVRLRVALALRGAAIADAGRDPQ